LGGVDRSIRLCPAEIQADPPHSEQIQRFARYRVMRRPQGAARENAMARIKLSPDWGVILRLIGVLRTHA
jgi:hypothetical protein